MRRLIRAGRGDRGAVGAIVAILLGGGVLLAMAALVVDVGRLYQEHSELQNGADAAVMAVAESCAEGTCTPSIAASYADANSSHGLEAVSVCGSGTLGTCPASTSSPTSCPTAPSSGYYADVQTSTLTQGGGTVIPPVFAGALAGNANYKGTTVYACAQASWSGPATATTVAFTISACTWDAATVLGTAFAPPPPATPSSTYDREISLTGEGSGRGCSTEPRGSDGSGVFGWTVDQTGNCGISVTSSTYTENTSSTPSSGCASLLASTLASRSVVYIPVYTTLTTRAFALKGFAAFVVTGYHLPGYTGYDWLNSSDNCTGSTYCIDGYFTQALITSSATPGGTDLGLRTAGLSG